jgi:hypothetical protein
MYYQARLRVLARIFLSATWLTVFALVSYGQVRPASKIVSPREHFGFELVEDRKLADWSQLTAYFHWLGRQSDRVKVQELGKTTEGRPFLPVTISGPQNLARHPLRLPASVSRAIRSHHKLLFNSLLYASASSQSHE